MFVVFSNAGCICPVRTGAKSLKAEKYIYKYIPVQRYIFSFYLKVKATVVYMML